MHYHSTINSEATQTGENKNTPSSDTNILDSLFNPPLAHPTHPKLTEMIPLVLYLCLTLTAALISVTSTQDITTNYWHRLVCVKYNDCSYVKQDINYHDPEPEPTKLDTLLQR